MSYLRWMAYLLIVLFGSTLAVTHIWKPAPETVYQGFTAEDVPRSLGAFPQSGDYQDARVKEIIPDADVLCRVYKNQTNSVDFVLIGATDRYMLHDPRTCLVGAGYRLEGDHSEHLPDANIDIRTCHALGRPGQPGFDVDYFYVTDGRVISSVPEIRAAMLWTALIGHNDKPSYFLRFLQPLSTDPQKAAADHAKMQDFVVQMWDTLHTRLETHF